MRIGLDGFLYGHNIIVARGTNVVTVGGSIPDSLGVFTNQICEATLISTWGMLSTTDNGVQTGVSFP